MKSLKQSIFKKKLLENIEQEVGESRSIYRGEQNENIDFSHVLYRNLIRQQFRWQNVLISPLILEAQLILYQMCCCNDSADDKDSKTVQILLDDYLQLKDRFANREEIIQHYERIFNSIAQTQNVAEGASTAFTALTDSKDEQNGESKTMMTLMTTYFILELVMLIVDKGRLERLPSICLFDEYRQLAEKSFMTRIVSYSRDIVHSASRNQEHYHPSQFFSNFRMKELLTEYLKTKRHENNVDEDDGGNGDGSSNVDRGKQDDSVDGNEGFMISSLTFKHKWFLPFSGYRTGYSKFHMKLENGTVTSKSVLMMFDNEILVNFMEIDGLDAKAIELPFEYSATEAAAAVSCGRGSCASGGDEAADDVMLDGMSMLLLLPNQRDGLHHLELQLTSIKLNEISDGMQMENVQILLPKFHIDWSSSLKSTLQNVRESNSILNLITWSTLSTSVNKMPNTQ